MWAWSCSKPLQYELFVAAIFGPGGPLLLRGLSAVRQEQLKRYLAALCNEALREDMGLESLKGRRDKVQTKVVA